MILEHCHSTSCTQMVESLQRQLAQCASVIQMQKEAIAGAYNAIQAHTEQCVRMYETREPVCWVLNDDIEYDGTTHLLTTINVCPADPSKWSPLYLSPHPADQRAGPQVRIPLEHP